MSDKPTWLEPFQFKQGQPSANPSGRPPIPDDIRRMKNDKSHEYQRKFYFWADAPIDDIVECRNAPWPTTGMDRMICSAMVQAFKGNPKAFNAILDRLLGKAIAHIEFTNLTPQGPDFNTIREKIKLALSDPEFKDHLKALKEKLGT